MAEPARQCVILVGGLGTRLGELTRHTPKPLLPVDGRPFLELLLAEAARHGFDRIVLLAGHLGGQVVERFAGPRRIGGRAVTVEVVVEPEPAGTGGALRFLLPVAEEHFLLMNGDSWFDLDLRAFAHAAGPAPVRMALRPVADASRFGTVELEGGLVRRFRPRGDAAGGLMNAGIYLMRREVIARVERTPCSLEGDVFPVLAAEGAIEGQVRDSFLLDIGVPDDYAAAPALLDRHRRRPALVLDAAALAAPDAAARIAAANAAGHYALALAAPTAALDAALAAQGAHLDGWAADAAALARDWPLA